MRRKADNLAMSRRIEGGQEGGCEGAFNQYHNVEQQKNSVQVAPSRLLATQD